MLSRSRSTFLGKKPFQACYTSIKEQFSWNYVIPLPVDVTTLVPYSQPFIVSPFKKFTVFEVVNIFKNSENIFWLVDPQQKNPNYLGFTQEVLNRVRESHVLSANSYEKLNLIFEGKCNIEDLEESIVDEIYNPFDFERVMANIKLAIARALKHEEIESLRVIHKIMSDEYYYDCLRDVFGINFMLDIQNHNKILWSDLSENSDLYQKFMLYLSACQNEFSRNIEYCIRRDKEGLKEDPSINCAIRMFSSLILHPIIKTPMFSLESDFNHPIAYISEFGKNMTKNKIIGKLNSGLQNSADLCLIFACLNKAGYYYEQGRVEEMTSCFNQAMARLQEHCYQEMYPKEFARLQDQLSVNRCLVAQEQSLSYRL